MYGPLGFRAGQLNYLSALFCHEYGTLQTGQEKQGASTGSQTQKGQAGPSPKQSNQYPGNGLPASRKPLASKGVSEAGKLLQTSGKDCL